MNRRSSRDDSTGMSSTDTSANVIHEGVGPHERLRPILAEPRAVALAWLGGYLALSAALLAAGGHQRLAAAHALAILVVGWTLVPRGRVARATGDLLPLFLAPLLYGEIPMLIAAIGGGGTGVALGRDYHDATIQRLESWVFGSQPSRSLAGQVPVLWLSELLHAGYLAYYVAIFVPPLALFVHRKRRAFAQTVAALTITYMICWVIFVLVPVEGPRYAWGASPTVPDGPIRRLTLHILTAGSSRGAAFPSSHMAVMVVQTVMAFRWQRRTAWALAAVTVLVGVGAVYGGFHYAVDMIVGAGLGGAIGAAVLFRRWRPLNP